MKFLVRIAIASVCVLLIGCVSHEYSDLDRRESAPIPYSLQLGDTVQIITADGEKHEVKIEGISDTGLTGSGTPIQFDDIRIIRVKNVDVEKTILDTGELTLWVMNLLLVIGLMILAGG